ncbi:DUF6351 family protein [Photobacterium sp. SDRW27]|uniref:DUF6351 family protein n=1 Tax=Photobacterium obscurum TaxID=2829490 RepID=UPI0022438252|nr:DUF6351 family protein [Photobacterium obscurum]MCW8328886.1 DUF6351 family protein [Photobacterium obscurum]
MRKVMFGLVGFLLLFITLGQMTDQDSLVARQVKAIATPEANYLLEINQHISKTQRPEETFPFPIKVGGVGPVSSLYSGPNQYPFYCMTLDSGLGQPLIDNQAGFGVPIYDMVTGKRHLGYSKDCSLKTRLTYVVVDTDNNLHSKTEFELKQLSLNKDDLLIRVEQGTINRYIYTILMPIQVEEVGNQSSANAWNKRLIYRFEGGSGIGYRQGRINLFRLINKELSQLKKGYALITSSGNKTSYGYNMLLAEDTARRVKAQFVSLFGKPLYTVGIGGSGGGLSQYLIGQNSQDILDGLLPLYSYPDMVSVATYALDCDLFNNYFSFLANDRARWQDWQNRQHVEGLRAINGAKQKAGWLQPLNQLLRWQKPEFPRGNNECINGYFGLSSYLNNPKEGFLKPYFHDSVVKQVNWNYWQDMVHIFGQDEHGFGLSTWDNVGVQYGLQALLNNHITFDEFIDLNRKIGSWKPLNEMKAERIISLSANTPPIWLSLWGNHNITKVDTVSAKRQSASLTAINKAYEYGQVFIGRISLPIIDIRNYLEDDLNMHHTSASFASRLRILNSQKHTQNHVIWISDKEYSPIEKAYDVMDKWLMAINLLPDQLSYQQKVQMAKPIMAKDACFAEKGNIIASGKDVFNGDWNQQPSGACTKLFPIYSNSRIKAGAPWQGSIFKCHTIPIDTAIENGIYGDLDLSAKVSALKQTFPDGVCDYTLGDMGKPKHLSH